MRLVVDANILVGELLRTRGKELVADKRLELFLAAKMWEEARHELGKRVDIIAERGQLSRETATELLHAAIFLSEQHVTVMSETEYSAFEEEARARIPSDPTDWHTVALALTLDAGIWTQDKDFLGCGVAVWTSTTLRTKLDRIGPPPA